MTKRLELIGQVYGFLTVKASAGVDYHRQTLWLCECVCEVVIFKYS